MHQQPKNLAHVDAAVPRPDIIARAADVLRGGGLVAFPTETVYGLGAHALESAAVRKIFAAKERPDWDPLIVHVSGVAMARSLAKTIPPHFERLANIFWPGPLTLIVEKADHVPDEVTARRSTIGLRVPRHPVAAALLGAAQVPIAAPSANRFGRPSPTRAEHVLDDLGERVDLILDAGPTLLGVESTVLDLTQSPPAILRPGGASREQLVAVLGAVTLAGGVAEEVAAKGLAAPGMTLKHYAPRARVELIQGAVDEMTTALKNRVEQLEREGKTFQVLATYGDNEQYARTLFAQMRDADSRNIDVILCIMPPPDGIGFAVRDRLLRAAGIGSQP